MSRHQGRCLFNSLCGDAYTEISAEVMSLLTQNSPSGHFVTGNQNTERRGEGEVLLTP
jgi:hypothetical protein